MKTINIQPMDEAAFAPFGEVIDFDRDLSFMINDGMCGRYHAIAHTDVTSDDGNAIISLFRATPYPLPLKLKLMERHPLGSQAFIPLQNNPYLVIVAPDEDGQPGTPMAFITKESQGVNYHKNVWHAVLTPISSPSDFAVVDREGEGNNLEEHYFSTPYTIVE
ncbi:MAG: ureidoglycolate lyase [Pseudomonadota bacterium]